MRKLYLALGRFLFRKSFVEGKEVVYEAWSPKEKAQYFYPRFDYSFPEAGTASFAEYDVERYKLGKLPERFATEEDALRASALLLAALRDLHEELKY